MGTGEEQNRWKQNKDRTRGGAHGSTWLPQHRHMATTTQAHGYHNKNTGHVKTETDETESKY